MCAKRHQQSFQTSNSSFWRQTGGAIPGRVNLTPSSGGGGAHSATGSSRHSAPHSAGFSSSSSAAAHSFNNFQESVSDAWDIEEPLTPPVKKGERVLESVHRQQHHQQQQRATPPRPVVGGGQLSAEDKRVINSAGGTVNALPPFSQNATGIKLLVILIFKSHQF